MSYAKEEIRNLPIQNNEVKIGEYFKQAEDFIQSLGSYSSYKSIAVSVCAEYIAYQDGFKIRDY